MVVNEAYENDNGFGAPSLSFDENEAAVVTFVGLEALHVDFDFVGVSANEDFDVQPHPENANAYIVSLTGGEDGAGIYQVSWEADCVPEPSTSLLGALGATLLVLRRRR